MWTVFPAVLFSGNEPMSGRAYEERAVLVRKTMSHDRSKGEVSGEPGGEPTRFKDAWDPPGGKRERIPSNCPLSSTHNLRHASLPQINNTV